MNKNQEELERIITDCKFREIPSVLANAILSVGYVKLSDVEKLKDDLMYDFPKHYDNYHIMAYQNGLKKLAHAIARASKEIIKIK